MSIQPIEPKAFHNRLITYFEQVAAAMRGHAAAAQVFPNGTDKGQAREEVYAEFLRQHAPSKCNVSFGGYLYGLDGSESTQLDVLVTTDTAPRYDFHNRNGAGKTFSPVDGTLAVASIKSTLDRKELFNALAGIASIPATNLEALVLSPGFYVSDYADWPYKIIYASAGIKTETLFDHLMQFYEENPEIPLERRPNLIHVAGQCLMMRTVKGLQIFKEDRFTRSPLPIGSFSYTTSDPDLQAILWVLNSIQAAAASTNQMLFQYGRVINDLLRLPNGSGAADAETPNSANTEDWMDSH